MSAFHLPRSSRRVAVGRTAAAQPLLLLSLLLLLLLLCSSPSAVAGSFGVALGGAARAALFSASSSASAISIGMGVSKPSVSSGGSLTVTVFTASSVCSGPGVTASQPLAQSLGQCDALASGGYVRYECRPAERKLVGRLYSDSSCVAPSAGAAAAELAFGLCIANDEGGSTRITGCTDGSEAEGGEPAPLQPNTVSVTAYSSATCGAGGVEAGMRMEVPANACVPGDSGSGKLQCRKAEGKVVMLSYTDGKCGAGEKRKEVTLGQCTADDDGGYVIVHDCTGAAAARAALTAVAMLLAALGAMGMQRAL